MFVLVSLAESNLWSVLANYLTRVTLAALKVNVCLLLSAYVRFSSFVHGRKLSSISELLYNITLKCDMLV